MKPTDFRTYEMVIKLFKLCQKMKAEPYSELWDNQRLSIWQTRSAAQFIASFKALAEGRIAVSCLAVSSLPCPLLLL